MRRAVFLAVLLAGRSLAALPPGVVRVDFPAGRIAQTPDGALYASGAPGIGPGVWRIANGQAEQVVAAAQIVYALAASPDGSVYFVTPDLGLQRYAAGVVTRIDPAPSSYQGLLVTGDGAVWYCSNANGTAGLYRTASGQSTRILGTQVGTLVAGSGNSVWVFEAGRPVVHHVMPDGSYTSHGSPVYGSDVAAAPDGAGGVWFAFYGGAVIDHLDANGSLGTAIDMPFPARVSSLLMTVNGKLYIGSTNAIYLYEHGAFTRLVFDAPPAVYSHCSDGSVRGYDFGPFVEAVDGSVWVVQTAPAGFGLGGFYCVPSPPELTGILHLSSQAFAARKHAVRR